MQLDDLFELPDVPTYGVLRSFHPAAPASPVDLSDDEGVEATAVAVAEVVGSAGAARHRIRAKLLALARAIRRPRTYVGYSAFVLMGLLKNCQPCMWEGGFCIDLMETFVPWKTDEDTKVIHVSGIPCTLVAIAGGAVLMHPVSEKHPLHSISHFVGGCYIAGSAVVAGTDGFEAFYAALGITAMASILDGDCAFDVMQMMLAETASFEGRTALRGEISDYLIARVDELWMHELMSRLQEVDAEDLAKSKMQEVRPTEVTHHAVVAPAPAVAAPAKEADEPEDVATLDEETYKALQWASKLNNYSALLSLMRSLPNAVIQEQVLLYRNRAPETAVAVTAKAEQSHIRIGPGSRYNLKMMVGHRFHFYCDSRGINGDQRMPYGYMKTFVRDNIIWNAKRKNAAALQCQSIRRWYKAWRETPAYASAAIGRKKTIRSERCLLKSRATVKSHSRFRGVGAGAKCKSPLVRQALYEWWSSIRYAIDWKQLAENRRSRGKKHLARFPRSVLRLKLLQLLADHAGACLLNSRPVQTVDPTSWWFRRWEEEYGLSMRFANRKYAVPRHVQKERMEIFWVVLFRVRLFIFLKFGYDPLILNWDQSPFHHNESGSQNKQILAVRCSTVPVVEGNSDVKSRWTAQLTTSSQFTAVAGCPDCPKPPAECMFKAVPDGPVDARLQEFLRSRGFPTWFTVTTGPKGSYREQDIISFLKKHLEPWSEGRDWRIMLADDFSAHKSENVWAFCWSRGYILLIHGGGSTPVGQTVDTDLNEHVRRDYGDKEVRLLIEQMRNGQNVPCLKPEDCMLLMLEVLSNPELHARGAAGYKSVGQSIDLYGKEDDLVVREAGVFWREVTVNKKHESMRPKINAELAELKSEYDEQRLKWSQQSVRRLITPYPPHRRVDAVLLALGEDAYHDDLQDFHCEKDDPAVAEEDGGVASESSDEDVSDDEPVAHTAVAVDVTNASIVEIEKSASTESVPLSAKQADLVEQINSSISALESSLEGLRACGSLRSVQCLESELAKERRRKRALQKESPVVADAFLSFRMVEEQDALLQRRLGEQQQKRKRDASKVMADRDAAVAELKRVRKAIADQEGFRAAKHAIKHFTVDTLGHALEGAGGVKCRNNRFEVLDRLSRIKVGLSAGQKNDWLWFKSSWDQAMLEEYGGDWPMIFSGWIQGVLDDERSNAFSLFVHRETARVFQNTSALNVPGS